MSSVIIVDYEDLTYRQRASKAIQHAPRCIRDYICSLFPVFEWIHRYNLSWLLQDIIAGITVGIVMVPQGMAYAKLANLDPQYGLYSSFAGTAIYCLFGTSKDISIGPISTVSLLVGQAVTTATTAHPSITPPEVGVTLALFVGIVAIAIGCIRLGILVDFIPGPAIAGFMTGSAITITLSQLPSLAGTSSSVDTHQSPYLVLVEFFRHLGETKVDLAFGLTSLVVLYAIKWICAYAQSRIPTFRERLRKAIFYFSIMRNGLIVILATLISFCINAVAIRGHQKDYDGAGAIKSNPFSIIEDVPAGFDALGVPVLNMTIIRSVAGTIPSIVLILILEHVSVAKSFGRIYNYTIRPDQEIFAIGICNIAGAFFGGYPSTGAFSRTAIMARSGSKTPLAGLCSATVVVLALYVLTPAFYYIPDAALAAVVIHAVSDLVSGYSYLKELWTASWFELSVWLCAVLITFFVDVEMGIYVAIGLSVIALLLRLARPPVQVLGRLQHGQYVCERDPVFISRLESLPHGLVVLRPIDSILYPNAAHVSEAILEAIKMRTTGCNNSSSNESENNNDNNNKNNHQQEDLLWNQDPVGPGDGRLQLPPLQALIFDFSAVRRLDATGLQMLVNLRKMLDNYAGQPVEWHFVHLNLDVRRRLLAFGFGTLPLVVKRETMPVKMSSLRSYDSIVANNGPPPPQDKYPCFHFTIDSAVKSVCMRRGFVHV